MDKVFYIIIGFLLIALLGYNSYEYWNREREEIRLSELELKKAAENDSLKRANDSLKQENIKLKETAVTIETEKKTNYGTYKEKSRADTEKPASEQGKVLKELIAK